MNALVKKIHQMQKSVADLELQIQRNSLDVWRSCCEVLCVSDINFETQTVETDDGIVFERVVIQSIGDYSDPKFFELIARGDPVLYDGIRSLFKQEYRDASPEDKEFVMNSPFLQHVLKNNIDFDDMVDAVQAITYLDGRLLKMAFKA